MLLPSMSDASPLFGLMRHAPDLLSSGSIHGERPLVGTTLFVATCPLTMRFGPCLAHVFQDIVDKQFVIALTFGDVRAAARVLIRIHSSCVTSETLRGCDCDCALQLEGAIRKMCEASNGVLFYMLQEGRGVGYVAKSRDRMLVQSSRDRVTTFEAYESMGLQRDHRSYKHISTILSMLQITAECVLLTNNPDKVRACKEFGVPVRHTEAIEFEPSPFNLFYLQSKARSGHTLAAAPAAAAASPPRLLLPFAPHVVPTAQRFVYMSSYYLPVKVVDDDVVVPPEDLPLWSGRGFPIRPISRLRHMVRVPADASGRYCYWFRVHVYYDIAHSNEHVVLTYGDDDDRCDDPVVRIQSESLFDRFPLAHLPNRDKMKRTVKDIVEHGSGIVVLLQTDGRGAGFAAHAVDRMLRSRGVDDAYHVLAIETDRRDYYAAMQLVRLHVRGPSVRMLVRSPASLATKLALMKAIHDTGVHVAAWMYLAAEESSPGTVSDSGPRC